MKTTLQTAYFYSGKQYTGLTKTFFNNFAGFHQCNFIYQRQKRTVTSARTLTKPRRSQRHYVQTCCDNHTTRHTAVTTILLAILL